MKPDYAVALLFLLICTVFDIKKKKIPVAAIVLCSFIALTIQFVTGSFQFDIVCRDITPGILLLVIAYATKESIGYGDGLMLLSIGLLIGLQLCLLLLLSSVLLSGIYSAIKIFLLHAERKEKIAFAPFLLCAWGVMLIGI